MNVPSRTNRCGYWVNSGVNLLGLYRLLVLPDQQAMEGDRHDQCARRSRRVLITQRDEDRPTSVSRFGAADSRVGLVHRAC